MWREFKSIVITPQVMRGALSAINSHIKNCPEPAYINKLDITAQKTPLPVSLSIIPKVIPRNRYPYMTGCERLKEYESIFFKIRHSFLFSNIMSIAPTFSFIKTKL